MAPFLTASPLDWPGLHCAQQLSTDNWTVEGHWENRTKRYLLEQAGKPVTTEDTISVEVVSIVPLPCWAHLPREQITEWVQERVEDIRTAYSHKTPLGVPAILRQRPTQSPKKSKRTYAPQFHCRNRELRREWKAIYRDFVKAFCRATTALDQASDEFGFPPGSFPPSGGFIPGPV